jgi:hypothetical protein
MQFCERLRLLTRSEGANSTWNSVGRRSIYHSWGCVHRPHSHTLARVVLVMSTNSVIKSTSASVFDLDQGHCNGPPICYLLGWLINVISSKLLLEDKLQCPGTWTGCQGPFTWLPQSLVLTPIDFFLCGHRKEGVYALRPRTARLGADVTTACSRGCRAAHCRLTWDGRRPLRTTVLFKSRPWFDHFIAYTTSGQSVSWKLNITRQLLYNIHTMESLCTKFVSSYICQKFEFRVVHAIRRVSPVGVNLMES